MKPFEIKPFPPKILLMGEPGVGKTVLAMTLGDRTKMIDFDGTGYLSGLKLQDDLTPLRREVDLIVTPGSENVPRYVDTDHAHPIAFRNFRADVLSIAEKCRSAEGYRDRDTGLPIRGLIIDSFTSLFEAGLRTILGNSGRIWGAPNLKDGTGPEIQHWSLNQNEIISALNVLRSLPLVVILVAHVQRDAIIQKASDGKIISQRDFLEVAVGGAKLPAKIPGFFDEVWYMRTTPDHKYLIQTQADGLVSCRTRYQVPDMTDTKVGMRGLLKLMGYDYPGIN